MRIPAFPGPLNETSKNNQKAHRPWKYLFLHICPKFCKGSRTDRSSQGNPEQQPWLDPASRDRFTMSQVGVRAWIQTLEPSRNGMHAKGRFFLSFFRYMYLSLKFPSGIGLSGAPWFHMRVSGSTRRGIHHPERWKNTEVTISVSLEPSDDA